MVTFLYSTDLHGSIPRYNALMETALKQEIKLIHLGADILPKGSHLFEIQKDFINKYLKSFYQKCKDNGITVLAHFGNDDVFPRKKYFKKFAPLLDEVPYVEEGFEFKAYGYVPDYKFGLKTACKLDYPGWTCPESYTQTPTYHTDKGIVEIDDVKQYFLQKGTIEDDLKNISADKKTIMSIHCPPCDLDLDACRPVMKVGSEYHWASEIIRKVGSRSVYKWIEKNQPLLVLCGHIHESYKVTNVWQAKIGKAIVIQPGQCLDNQDLVRAVLINISENDVKTELLEIPAKGVSDDFIQKQKDHLFRNLIDMYNWVPSNKRMPDKS